MDFSQAPHLFLKSDIPSGRVSWRSPSNIALVKYWGKYGNQLPQNPSLSFTLSQAYTETTLIYGPKNGESDQFSVVFYLDDQRNEDFEQRIKNYFNKLLKVFPFLEQLNFEIRSRNSFPHSVGIASSASGMSALALCLCTIEHELFGTLENDELFRRKSSFIARIGSGSACRSIYARLSLWGQTGLVSGASNEYAVPIIEGIDPVFESFCDSILVVHHQVKKVSSSIGHQLMESNPFAPVRYEEAKRHLHQMLEVMRRGELDDFGKLCEMEAMQLHALMMCSNPSYILMQPNTIKIVALIKEFRQSTQYPVYFTLDAGPNMHLLYPKNYKPAVENFIRDVLVEYCENGAWISDTVGEGPLQI